MTITGIGAFAMLVGVLALWRSAGFELAAFAISLLFGAAAGIILDNFGGVNLLLGHIFLGFLCLRAIMEPSQFSRGLRALAPGRAGYWFALLVAYGALTAIFLPRLFAGATAVYAVARGGDPTLGPVVLPLAPVSGNLSQTFYIVSDLACFFVCSAAVRESKGLLTLAIATVAAAALNLGFAVLDYATFAAGQSDALAFMRNATYRMLDDVQVLGYKRIVGSFSEASAFAGATLGYFAFTARLALAQRWLKVTAPLAVLSVVALLASTSTTGYVGLAVCVAALYLVAIRNAILRRGSRAGAAFLLAGPPLVAALVLAMILEGSLWAQATQLVDQIIFAKASSDSGRERGAWNAVALQSFLDTHLLGAGVGSLRAASFPIAVLASVGVPGALLFVPFLYHVLAKPIRSAGADSLRADVRMAARFSSFALLLVATLAGAFIDLGLPFFVFAAMATAEPHLETVSRAFGDARLRVWRSRYSGASAS